MSSGLSVNKEGEYMEPFKLPENLLLGTATASLQIEGGDKNNNWYRFCESGKVKDGTHCIIAADHWNRYEEDIGLMKLLNMQTYRMSIEWSRIEPEKGIFNNDAIEHYRSELKMLIENNIVPLVTLYHFSHPIWFEDMGAWDSKEAVDCFNRFTEKAITVFGDLVSDWVTINEPNAYLDSVYCAGNFPAPNLNIAAYFKAMRKLALAHIEAYKIIHAVRKNNKFPGRTLVGAANHLRVFDVDRNDIFTRFARSLADWNFHTLLLDGTMLGKFNFPIGFGTYPLGMGEYCDFLGINYYTRDIMTFTTKINRLFADVSVKKEAEVNDLGWEIYPEGLYRICRKYYQKYGKPIFITENGICDCKDEKRTRFIYDHLRMVKKLMDEGVDVQRYYHWSLIDNFEWDDGLTPRFGLIEVDYKTRKRTIRNSGLFYGEIAKSHEVTNDMLVRCL